MITSRVFPSVLSIDAAEALRPCAPGAFQRAIAALARFGASGTADTRERYLSQSVDHQDLENRIRAWEAHEARLRPLPPVL